MTVDYSRRLDMDMDDINAKIMFRFSFAELRRLANVLQLPEIIETDQIDKVCRVEAMAMVCRRLAEPVRLGTMANEFGRSPSSMSRMINTTINFIFELHKDLIFFNEKIATARFETYADAVRSKGATLHCVWAFIDGTKQYICRPSPRCSGQIPHWNLQRSVYNGSPRRHCLNYQGITTPDGLLISMFGPFESRRHDSTMLSLSGMLEVLRSLFSFEGKLIYGDSAYGCSDLVCCPFTQAEPGSREANFNSAMSSVRESVEWSFGRLKTLWPPVAYDKKQKVRQFTIGRRFLLAALLTNFHCCLQPNGNQI